MKFFIIYFLLLLSLLFLGLVYWFRYSKKGKGITAELVTTHFLRNLNPTEYKIINDLTLVNGTDTTQIDHIVVSKYGIFVIETKGWFQTLYGSITDYWWKNRKGFEIKNVSNQNFKHLKFIEKVLNNYNIPLISITAFSGYSHLNIEGYRSNTYVVNISKVLGIINSYKQTVLTDIDVEDIYTKLTSFQNNKRKLKKLHLENMKKKENPR